MPEGRTGNKKKLRIRGFSRGTPENGGLGQRTNWLNGVSGELHNGGEYGMD